MEEHLFRLYMRILIVCYFIFAHITRIILLSTALKIKYINHKPWPYKPMWHDFITGDFY